MWKIRSDILAHQIALLFGGSVTGAAIGTGLGTGTGWWVYGSAIVGGLFGIFLSCLHGEEF